MTPTHQLMRRLKECRPKVDAPAPVNSHLPVSSPISRLESSLEIPVPAGRAYLPFQRAGIEFLDRKKNALLSDEMGLGKTIQVCGLLNLRPELRHILIICPASLKLNWARELDAWLIPDFKRSLAIWNSGSDNPIHDIVIVNFDLLQRYEHSLKSRRWDLIVFDEAHYLKTPRARRTVLARSLASYTARIVLLTGTPLLGRVVELWSLLNLLDPASWPNFYAYAHRYCDACRTPWGWNFGGHSHLDELQCRLRNQGFILRRRKSEVLPQLPRVTRQVIALAGGSAMLDQLEQKLLEELKLPQLPASLDPDQIPFELMSQIRRLTGEVKVGPAIAFLEEQTGEYEGKVVLFGHHQNVLEALFNAFKSRSVLVTGSTAVAERQKRLDAFQHQPEIKYFIASTQSMGVGVSLTASSHVIFIEPDWTPAILDQAESRLHRIGQSEAILSQYLVLENSLDEKILNAVHAKLRVINAVV